MKLPRFLNDILTTADGVSFDGIRLSLILGVIALISFTGWDVIANKAHFAAIEFGTGYAAVLAGAGVGIGAKRKDEPNPDSAPS